MIFDPEKILVKSLEDSCGLTSYSKTLQFKGINVATDTENYTNYYRVRRDSNWLKEYYTVFEKNKNRTSITFEEILRHLSNIPHKVKISSKHPDGMAATIEASFSSKMLATINPHSPIWDSQVIKALGISINESLSGEKNIAYVETYEKLR